MGRENCYNPGLNINPKHVAYLPMLDNKNIFPVPSWLPPCIFSRYRSENYETNTFLQEDNNVHVLNSTSHLLEGSRSGQCLPSLEIYIMESRNIWAI